MSSLRRLQAAAASILLRLSDTTPARTSFQLYVSTKDLEKGSESWSSSGSPVLAAMARDMETRSLAGVGDDGDRKVRKNVEVWHVEIPAFEAVGGLTDDYRPTVDGVERSIESLTVAEDETYHVVTLSTGGS